MLDKEITALIGNDDLQLSPAQAGGAKKKKASKKKSKSKSKSSKKKTTN